MQKYAMVFSAMFLVVAFAMFFGILFFNLHQLISGNKVVWFALTNSIMLIGVGIFFIIFKKRIILYFENYRREKQI